MCTANSSNQRQHIHGNLAIAMVVSSYLHGEVLWLLCPHLLIPVTLQVVFVTAVG